MSGKELRALVRSIPTDKLTDEEMEVTIVWLLKKMDSPESTVSWLKILLNHAHIARSLYGYARDQAKREAS